MNILEAICAECDACLDAAAKYPHRHIAWGETLLRIKELAHELNVQFDAAQFATSRENPPSEQKTDTSTSSGVVAVSPSLRNELVASNASFQSLLTAYKQLADRADALVENDSHAHSCQFRGCSCGSIEAYKAARTEYLRHKRERSAAETLVEHWASVEHWKSKWNLALESALDAHQTLQKVRNICENSNPTYRTRIEQIVSLLAESGAPAKEK